MILLPSTSLRILRRVAPVFVAVAVCLSGAISGQEENQELAQARALFEKDIEFASKPIRDRYISRLESLKRSLGARGDARGAAAVQDEIDRIREAVPAQQSFAKFAGTWTVKYNNGAIHHYVITADGQVTHDDNDTNPPKKAKLVIKGNDVMLDINDLWIERLAIKGGKLLVENFSPKTLYPTGRANSLGTGSKD